MLVATPLQVSNRGQQWAAAASAGTEMQGFTLSSWKRHSSERPTLVYLPHFSEAALVMRSNGEIWRSPVSEARVKDLKRDF